MVRTGEENEPFMLGPFSLFCVEELSLVGCPTSEPSMDEMDMLLSRRLVGRAETPLAPVKEGGRGMLGRDDVV